MSKPSRLDLPRFDPPAGLPPALRLKAVLADETGSDPISTRPCDDEPECEVPAPDPEPEATAQALPEDPDNAQLQAMLSALSEAMYRLEDEARTRTDRTIRSMAAQLFPVLSDLFLAEEIGRHLPEIVPSDVPVVEIRAEARLAEQLRCMLETSDPLSTKCTVAVDVDQTGGRVDIGWDQGGLALNFEALLDACLARLESHSEEPER